MGQEGPGTRRQRNAESAGGKGRKIQTRPVAAACKIQNASSLIVLKFKVRSQICAFFFDQL